MDQQQEHWFQFMTEHLQRAPPPRLTLQKFSEASDDMGAYLDTFEVIARTSDWPRTQWPIYLRGSLSGAGLLAVTALPASQQTDYAMVKRVQLATYRISTETHQRKVFKRAFNTANSDQWLQEYRQNFNQWLDHRET